LSRGVPLLLLCVRWASRRYIRISLGGGCGSASRRCGSSTTKMWRARLRGLALPLKNRPEVPTAEFVTVLTSLINHEDDTARANSAGHSRMSSTPFRLIPSSQDPIVPQSQLATRYRQRPDPQEGVSDVCTRARRPFAEAGFPFRRCRSLKWGRMWVSLVKSWTVATQDSPLAKEVYPDRTAAAVLSVIN